MKTQVSVVITTRERPEMLGHALASVRRQTRIGSIHQVIVSENGLTEASRKICEQFGDLPLLYIKQEPPVSSLLHLKALWPHIESPLVAILHDDDWWMPEHLDYALGALETHPECVATFSNFLDSWGPTFVPWHTVKAWRVWAACNCDFSPSLLMLEKVDVLLACLIESSFHYSTLVARKDAFWETYLKMVAAENVWDNERTFPVMLSTLGRIGYFTRHNAVIRTHPGQEGLDSAFQEQGFEEMRIKTTRWLAQWEPETTALAVKRFNDRISGHRAVVVGAVAQHVSDLQKSVLVQELGLKLIPSPAPAAETARDMPRDTKWLFKQLCPPAVLALRRRAKRKLQQLAARK